METNKIMITIANEVKKKNRAAVARECKTSTRTISRIIAGDVTKYNIDTVLYCCKIWEDGEYNG